jgi:hypothetical protein
MRDIHALRRSALQRTGSMTALLGLLVVVVFVVPVVVPYGDVGRILIEVFFILMLLSGAWAVAEHPVAGVVIGVLCAATVVVTMAPTVLAAFLSPEQLPVVRQVGAMLAVLLLAAMVAIRVFAAGTITADRIMGAIALYMILGVAWGNAYEIVALVVPNAFTVPPDPTRGLERWFYFSFVTLTTVGYGDITPVDRAARALAIGEALCGQLFPAIVLARLVTLQAGVPPQTPPGPPRPG